MLAGEVQTLADGPGHSERMRCLVREASDASLDPRARHVSSRSRASVAAIACNSAYDDVTSSEATVKDKRASIAVHDRSEDPIRTGDDSKVVSHGL